MTTRTPEKVETPELDSPRGYYGGSTVSHVKNLLARATVASVAGGLSPEIIRKMRRHYQVASCLLVQSLPLIRADWSIECEDEEIRDRLTEAYKAISFDVQRSSTRALWAGYSPNSLTWSYRDDLRGIYPSEVRDLEPRTCAPLVDDFGTFDGFKQTIAGNVDDDEIEPLYALWIVEGMESGNLYGRSLLDAALDPWADYAAIRAFHARYLERFGEPVVLARAPEGKTIANLSDIEAAVAANGDKVEGDAGYVAPPQPVLEDNLATALEVGQSIKHHSVVALPSRLLFGADGKATGYAWQLEFLEAKGGHGDDFLNALRETDKRIGRAMFVPDLLSQNTEDVGSNALGQTHKSVWTESVEGRLDDYSRQITKQLIEPARVLNFGAGSSPARLVFSPLNDEEKDRNWELIVQLVKTGKLPIDVRELVAKYDIPLVDEGDEIEEETPEPEPVVEEPPVVEPPVEEDLAAPRHDHPFGRPAAGLLFAAADPTAGLPDWKVPQAYNPGDYRRALNAREERVGFAAIERGLNSSEEETLAKLTELLDGEHDRVLRQIAGIMGKGTPAEILAGLGTIELKAGPAVAKAWADLMSAVSGLAIEQLRTELAAYAEQLPTTLGAEGRALFKSYAQTSADRAMTGLLTEVRLSLLNAYTSGVGRAGMSAIVGQVFDAWQGSEGKPVRLTSRMLSAKSLNYSRAAAIERGGIPLAGAQYSAILDRVTCGLCEKLDEKVIPIEHTDLSRFTPPIHHNCRCVWVWITRDEEDFTPTWVTPSATDVDRFGGLVI